MDVSSSLCWIKRCTERNFFGFSCLLPSWRWCVLKWFILIENIWIRDFEPKLKSHRGWLHPSSASFEGSSPSQKSRSCLLLLTTEMVLFENINARLRKCRAHLKKNGVIIMHDKARRQEGVSIVGFFENKNCEIFPHTPYIPDMNYSRLWFVSQVEGRTLKESDLPT